VKGQGRLAPRFGAEDLHDPAPGHTAHTQGDVQAQGPGGNGRDIDFLRAPQAHDGPFAELTLDLGDRQIDGFRFVRIPCHALLRFKFGCIGS
jgi:hypothetical protein